MKARNGQVALYLLMVLVAITFLVMMNVGSFVAVSAKNRTMNAGDAAALAVARHQGELLNRMGRLNIEHLQAALDNDEAKCAEIMREQERLCFLGPLDGIARGSEAAVANGMAASEEMGNILEQHVHDVRNIYAQNPQSYPEPWEGAWEEYAIQLQLAIGNGVAAGPDNITFIDAAGGHMLLSPDFYNAVAGRNWCWFHFNARDLIETYSTYRDWGPLPVADEYTRRRRCVNSEVYSLHLKVQVGNIFSALIANDDGEGTYEERAERATNIVMRLADCSFSDIAKSYVITNTAQAWYFYDRGEWREWWEIDPDDGFPVVGSVKPEYNVRGCAAICRVQTRFPNLVARDADRSQDQDEGAMCLSRWSAAAKPFGTEEGLDEETALVTALDGLVTPAFAEVRLVPLDAVGGQNLSTADADWMTHVREHLPVYMVNGPNGMPNGCYWCEQLKTWEMTAFREMGLRWLRVNSGSCHRPGPGGSRGGTAHGH